MVKPLVFAWVALAECDHSPPKLNWSHPAARRSAPSNTSNLPLRTLFQYDPIFLVIKYLERGAGDERSCVREGD